MIISYNKLWKLIIDKGINKTQLREMTGITTNILAKLGKNESVQIEVLAKICEVLECDLTDIVEIKKAIRYLNQWVGGCSYGFWKYVKRRINRIYK